MVYQFQLKSRFAAYDGRGNCPIYNNLDIERAVTALGGFEKSLYIEKWVHYKKELAVMVARSTTEEFAVYPVVETIQSVDGICNAVIAPANISQTVSDKAQELAERVIEAFEGTGVFGVEMFLLEDNKTVIINEVAPRPHNSGHYTMEACYTDQFEQHLRAILGLPLGSTKMKVPHALMLNILGTGDFKTTAKPLLNAYNIAEATTYWYGKDKDVHLRKMGHITIVGNDKKDIEYILTKIGIDNPYRDVDTSRNVPIVSVIMGSKSDLDVMGDALHTLKQFEVPHEVKIVSAHRTPEYMFEYAKNAHTQDIKVIIAGAGGAAHLPGMVASLTHLPVIGVPVKSSALNGQDSLLSIVQMPRGVPVATVAINNSINAALLAIRILSLQNKNLVDKLQKYRTDMKNKVLEHTQEFRKINDDL